MTQTRTSSPRFGPASEFLSGFTIALPSGLTSSTAIEETPTLADPADPLSLITLSTTTDVNGRVFTETFDRASLRGR